MWDGEVVATAQADPGGHFTTLTSDPATLCAGIDPDPLGKCKGTWDRPDQDGCVGIIQRGRACRGQKTEVFPSIHIIQTIISPRQARDKRREK